MRIITAALLIAALPAAADAREPASSPRITADQAATALQNPLVQDGLAQAIAQLAGIVLDTRVGPLAAVAPDSGIRPDDTLHDLARRSDPGFDGHVHDRARAAVVAAGGVAAEARELDRTATRLKAALAPLLAYAGSPERR